VQVKGLPAKNERIYSLLRTSLVEKRAGHVMDLMKSEHVSFLILTIMKTILKKLNLGAIAVLLGVVGLTVSWKNHESKKATATWYEVII